MKPILLLKTGDLAKKVAEQFGPYERMFFDILGEEALVVVDARTEEAADQDWAGVLITGSPASTYDGEPWIARSEGLLRRAADRSIPLLGVCFGHQLLAQTFGGKVEKCRRGWELGTEQVTLTAAGQADPLFAGLPATFDVQMSHGDEAFELPPGAVVLAGNEHSPHQAFRLGDAIWGTQFHPEFTAAVVTTLIEVFFARPQPTAFPRWISGQDALRKRLLASVRETSEAPRCLLNFAELAAVRSRG